MKTGTLDIPALVPSTLGHRAQHSISSSSNSSTSWSGVTEEDENEHFVYGGESTDMLSEGSKSPGYLSGLFYARRPAPTNHRAIVPMLHRHATSSSASSLGVPHSVPSPFYASTEDDASSVCMSELSLHDENEREGTPSQRRKRNRASLPAYFSLLQGASTGPSSPMSRSRKGPSALQSISRSLQASPTTPKVAHATVVLTNVEAHIENTPRGRGRRRERDPEARSASSRRSTARSPLRHHHLSAVQRARIDSVEKVAEWVSSSPVINIPGRRNSSPPRKPRFVEALTQGLRDCAIASDDEDDDVSREKDAARAEYERTLRGRRRAEELDEPLAGEAPGYGNGRSGLKARERGRAPTARAIGIAVR